MVELITDYFEDALPGETRARFEAHIATCDACTKYVEQMRVTMSVVGHVGAAGLDPRVEQELLDAFRDWKAGA
jgi:anti-sigma factor RsiW